MAQRRAEELLVELGESRRYSVAGCCQCRTGQELLTTEIIGPTESKLTVRNDLCVLFGEADIK